jgi:membrane protease YdiL (CAAX protease family)
MNQDFKKEIFMYLSIVYGITYAAVCICNIINVDYRNFVPYSMLLPTLGAVVTTLIYKKKFNYIFTNLKINKWVIIGPIAIILIYIVSSTLQLIFYKFTFKQLNLVRMPSIVVFMENIVLGITLGGLGALFEEIGWRGFLQSRLTSKNTFTNYFVVGLCWSVFHFPQIFNGLIYKGHLIAGLIIHTCILVSFGILLCYLRIKSSSLICTSATHGLFNALIFSQATEVVTGGNQLIEGTLWAFLFIIVVMSLFFKDFRKNSCTSEYFIES